MTTICGIEFENQLDIDEEMQVRMVTASACDGEASDWLDREDAINIITHLKLVFEIKG